MYAWFVMCTNNHAFLKGMYIRHITIFDFINNIDVMNTTWYVNFYKFSVALLFSPVISSIFYPLAVIDVNTIRNFIRVSH